MKQEIVLLKSDMGNLTATASGIWLWKDEDALSVSWEEIIAAQQSVHPTLLTRCPKCNAVTGWHHEACEDYLPETQSG